MRVKPTPGQLVTCRFETAAYYSNYGLNKGQHIIFFPGMVGTVVSIAPKVTMPKRGVKLPPDVDWKNEFVVVDYQDENGKTQRVGLNFCNVSPL
jgi:hypothetical protein